MPHNDALKENGGGAGTRITDTVDLSPFFTEAGRALPDSAARTEAGKALVDALHSFGFVKVVGHGLSKHEIDEALGWTKKLFDLPYDDKMKAPHPPGPMPHRGYSGVGKEKVYSKDDVTATTSSDRGDVGKVLRKISDFKESYEIGSEQDPVQQNIWLPDDVLSGFRGYMTSLYHRLSGVSKVLLDAIGVGLGLEGDDYAALTGLVSDRHCQLRLLHYPPIGKEKLQNELLARLPAHTDWGTFTLLFQDQHGGLELKDAKTKEYLHAEPEEGAFVLNAGDMLQRFTNDYITSSLHRVSVPDPNTVPDSGIPARYSVPFFTCPDFSHTVATLPRFVTPESPAKYEPVRFDQYGSIVSKYQYQGEE